MSLKRSKGNMYDWVTHTHCHLGGECLHACSYCYVENPRFGRPEKYQGPLRLIEEEFQVSYGTGKTIFVENCNDLFAKGVPNFFISRILEHCRRWPLSTYVFQTKNPWSYSEWLEHLPPLVILGATVETNREIPDVSKAPTPLSRLAAMRNLRQRKFLTLEPILDFDVEVLAGWIDRVRPEFVNVGADSKGHGLAEPTFEKVLQLIERLKRWGIEIREKNNLGRLKEKG